MNQALYAIVEQVKQLSNGKCSEYELHISRSQGFTVDVRDQQVDSLEHQHDSSIDITVYINQAKACTSTTDVRPNAIKTAFDAACHIAKFTQSDNCAGLIDKHHLAFDYKDVDLYHPWSISPEQAIDMAKQCEAIARQQDTRISHSDGVCIDTVSGDYIYANSHDFVGQYASSKHYLSCCMIAEDNHGMQRDHAYTIARNPEQLQSLSYVAKHCVKKTLSRLGVKPIKTQKVPVLFTAEVAKSLLGHFVAAIQGGAIYRQSSFLLDKCEQAIFPDWVNIQEFPQLSGALGSAPFDGEGANLYNNQFIVDGVLKQYALNSYAARKLSLRSTGNAGGVRNLQIQSTGQHFDGLIKQMHRGLIVTDLMGQGVKLTTGNYSRGASGFWVESGEIQHPVHEVTIAGNLLNMYQGLIAISDDVNQQANLRTGSWLIDHMTVAGNQ